MPRTLTGGDTVTAPGLRLGALFGPAVFGVTAAGVALPAVIAGLRADPAAATWVLTVHALALGVGTALFGRLADAVGVRAVLWSGSAITAAGTVVCLFAPGLGSLVAGRALLALGSGALAAGGLALGAATDPERRPRVLAVFGAVIAVFAAAATFAGGVVTDVLSWRVALVLPVLSILAVPLCLPLARAHGARQGVDVLGALLLAATATAGLVLIQARTLRLPLAVTLACALAVAAGAIALWRRIATRPDGFVPRDVVTDPRFLRAAAVGAGVYAGLFATMYAVPQLLAREHHWGVLAVGAALLPGAVLGAVVSRVAARPAVLAAVAIAAAVTGAAAGLVGGGPWGLVVGASLATTGFATTQVVATGRVSAAVEPRRRGAAMGLLNLCFFVGGAAGSALAGALAEPLGLGGALAVAAVPPLLAGLLAPGLRKS
ncbi:MFS transporter [Phytomonospora sp. NPDC050363]|uniref:MFS transporter n=1 Tax=Phytomonospora sp. NPDC050363 TaxID=3155642 RepID=UPI0033E6D858